MPNYDEAPSVAAVAAELVPEHHRHLLDCRITFVFRDKFPDSSEGCAILARARKITGLNAFLAQDDNGERDFFVIEVSEEAWVELDDRMRTALVDHELTHCQVDDKGLVIRGHDVEEFTSIAGRHGAWHGGLQSLVDAARGGPLLATLDASFH